MIDRRLGLSARCAAILGLCFVAEATLAQTVANRPPAAPDQGNIVVEGQSEQKSEWKRAETDHVIVFSKGNEHELKRVTRNLETLHYLLARLYRQGDTSDEALKLQVTLVDSQSRLRAMGLTDLRSQEGPFPLSYANERYYDPRDNGEILVVSRSDQTIDLNTTRRFNADCDDYQADGGQDMCAVAVKRPVPLVRSWEAVLYGAYAQRFLLTYLPAAYPRWYLDGIAALFSTIDVHGSGTIDYAVNPDGYKGVFRSYDYPDAGAILSGRYLDDPKGSTGWSPYGAWLLAHYFLYSNLKPERAKQFQQYMTAIHQGKPMAEAAAVFGDMTRLQRDIVGYAKGDISYAHAMAPATPISEPLVTTLSVSSGAIVEARIGIESGGAGTDWLAQAPDTTEALLLTAETQCRSGRADDCLATAERVLNRFPDNADALAWKGAALTDKAVAGPAASRADMLAEARRTLQRAVKLDGQGAWPQIAYFQSFAKAGERVPDDGVRGMAIVIRNIPAAPGPRLYLGQELLRQGKADLARRVLYPVLYGAYDSPEKKAAARLFASTGG